jgi:hypothetical protein
MSSRRHFGRVMPRKLWLLLSLLLWATGCREGGVDRKAQAIAETNRHIDQGSALPTRFSRINEFTPPQEVASTLRMFAYDVSQWQRTYAANRAKLLARNITRREAGALSKRYQATVEELKLKVEQTERRLAKRSDSRLFQAELLRVRDAMRRL